jgi:hypothetical protein
LLFAFFGLSDLVEVTTGAWWRPWWLLAWKAACLLGLIAIGLHHWHRENAASEADTRH